MHPSYFSGDQRHDLAVLRLATPVAGYHLAVRPVCLPPPALATENGDVCWASGWGRDVVQYDSTTAPLADVVVHFTSTGVCQLTLASKEPLTYLWSGLCLQAVDVDGDLCKLDPGSPVVCASGGRGATLAGVVSWAHRCAGRHHAPLIVATAIASHLDWIGAALQT
ncbi:transmembrane protease serine 5-like [Pollicipes pollicipes]|uniref:transmembrane protease serine 5-like n=1 Tax=Pollicipes pollicipes TaxID=41117 RepID=UPI001884F5FD|nr:transmembrane protease serine 5-like [Pollicipes pollicipes]